MRRVPCRYRAIMEREIDEYDSLRRAHVVEHVARVVGAAIEPESYLDARLLEIGQTDGARRQAHIVFGSRGFGIHLTTPRFKSWPTGTRESSTIPSGERLVRTLGCSRADARGVARADPWRDSTSPEDCEERPCLDAARPGTRLWGCRRSGSASRCACLR
jgi:hypothetical protein